MRITLGNNSRDAMKRLGIKEYPFTSIELKGQFRTMVRGVHSDLNGNDPGNNELTRKVIEAYNHLKNLAIDKEGADFQSFEDDSDDLFNLKKTCSHCNGTGKWEKEIWVDEECPKCNGTMKVQLKCRFCNDGKFKQKHGRVVDCYKCKGTGIWKTVNCNQCNRNEFYHHPIFGRMFAGRQQFGHYEKALVNCPKCNGTGKIKVNPFNPVIPKGAVLA